MTETILDSLESSDIQGSSELTQDSRSMSDGVEKRAWHPLIIGQHCLNLQERHLHQIPQK